MALTSHFWTVYPTLHPDRPEVESTPWSLWFAEPGRPPVRLSGALSEVEGSADLVVVLHGIGGCVDSKYMLRAARRVLDLGVSCLRLNLRGCDRRSSDYYHAGLTADLASVIDSFGPDRRIHILGHSMGGHIALRYATEHPAPNVAGVAALCSPLFLEPCCQHIDRPALWPYRRFVLRNLKSIYRAVASRAPVPAPVEEVEKVSTLREWDGRVVAPRWGFASAEDYYRRASVGPRLDELKVPALLVGSRKDPMVPPLALQAPKGWRSPLETLWIDGGGHLGFPDDLDLGLDGPRGLVGQALAWLLSRP